MATWRELLTESMIANDETWEDVEAHTFVDGQIDEEFDDGLGCENGCAFTVWTKKSVYFPVINDGAEWIGRVARHPDGKPTGHVGG